MLGLALVIAACGQQAGRPADVPAPSDVVYVQDGDHVVRIDAAGVTTVSRAGVLSHDGAHRFTAETDGGGTVVTKVDARSGSALGAVHLPGRFELTSYGGSALSQNGEWLVATSDAPGVRRFAVVSTTNVLLLTVVELPSNFELDAIDDAGRGLYVIERPDPRTNGYNVRLYDITAKKLIAEPIHDVKTAGFTPDQVARGIMRGIQRGVANGPLGWQFGLFFDPARGPFVHALNLRARHAFCILDLPKVLDAPGMWSIGMKGSAALYLVNGQTGDVVEIDPESFQTSRTRKLGILPGAAREISAPIAMSADGRRMFAVGARGAIAIDADLSLRGHWLRDRTLAALALSPDGKRLYAIDAGDGAVLRVDASTGGGLVEVARLARPVAITGVDAR
jgi:hypothetical protein